MIKSIIVDDEAKNRNLLQQLLKKYFPAVSVAGEAESVSQAVELIKTTNPDLVFLDIEMPHETGFDLLRKLDHIGFEVIFVTAFDHYAIKAFKFSAIDYLLKPIDIDELRGAIDRASAIIKHKKTPKPAGSANEDNRFDMLFNNIKNIQNPFNKISLPTRDGLVFIQINDIIRCESDVNYTRFSLTNGKVIIAAKTLKDYEEMLADYNFYRVHKSHLINLNHIQRYMRGEGGSVIMSDGAEVEVSRRNKEGFLTRLSELQ